MTPENSLPILFTYEGDSHSVDANTLIISQLNFVNLINEVSRFTLAKDSASLTLAPKLQRRSMATDGCYSLHP